MQKLLFVFSVLLTVVLATAPFQVQCPSFHLLGRPKGNSPYFEVSSYKRVIKDTPEQLPIVYKLAAGTNQLS
ncbi:AKR_collapsed_G0047250.mRNA.1.CDS.1 [Saccharomyces cerevisiae]|nr:AKR_collapsed_G0047250.mRNA.1.CDS.1 [Saccharomyces cerevisiae]